ncbi:MAG: 50S ribosomal protein L5 [Candidatus Harrisonbacteria bacterium]|nr:50S ribosomal protein L5 [Candidatus Harrisonbacteria bacterium]
MKTDVFAQLEKVVVNAGIGRLAQSPNFSDKVLPEVISDFTGITGQKPMLAPAKKSIAGFKIREGTVVGLKATLRRKRMRDFFSKVVHVVLPRLRDFRGISETAVDERGNLTIGIKEHIVFPEVNMETVKVSFGLEVTVVPRERKRAKALALYRAIGVPFKKQEATKKKV